MLSRKLNKLILDKIIYYRNTTSIMPKSLLSSSQSIPNNERNAPSPSTIDFVNLELFTKQMKDWWNPDGKMALLHSMNLLRVPFIRDGLVNTPRKGPYPLKDIKILDVGCGGGILSEGLARLGANVTGIDASKDLIHLAEKHKSVDPKIAGNKPRYFHSTMEEHANLVTNFYDGVVASEVIEHVTNQELFVKSCIKSLKPGGKIFFTTPNRTRLSQLLVIYLGENVFKFLPQGAHQYEKFIKPNELTFILERNNCHVEMLYGVTYNPVSRKWDFTQFQELMYALQAVKLN